MKNRALTFIFITLLIDVMGIGLIIPVMPALLTELTGKPTSDVARIGGLLMFVYAVCQFIFSPVMGGLSDRYGRRPVLILSLLGLGADYLFLSWAPTIQWLFVGRIIAGISGASFTTAGAYIADVSTPEKRAQNFGLIGAAFGLGFILGPVLGGLLGDHGLRMPFIVAACLSLTNALFGFFVLPESLALEHRRPFDWKRANPVGMIIRILKFPVLMILFGAILLMNIAGQVHPSTWTYFTTKEFGWTSSQIGLSLAFVGFMIALVQGFLSRKLIPKLGVNRSVIVGSVFSILGFALFSFANQGWMMYAIMVPFALSGLAGPALQSIISQKVSPSEQGELQGMLTSLMSLSSILGPLLATNLFAYFSDTNAPVYYPGAAFMSASILSCGALIMVLWSFRVKNKS